MKEANFVLRFHATPIPIIVPRKKLIIVAVPMRPTVQGTATWRTRPTGVGNLEIEIPRSPLIRFSRYFPYWSRRGSVESTPKAAFIASSDSRGMPCILSIKSCAGSPGIILGMKKFRVTATNKANSSKPIFLAK